jgi:hypothetical protein
MNCPGIEVGISKLMYLCAISSLMQKDGPYPAEQAKEQAKKGFASLRLCVSSLHRDHANLLCIFKRLFNATGRNRGNVVGDF